MATLTCSQLKHAEARIAQHRDAYITRETAKLGKRPTTLDYTVEEKLAFIRSGKATLKNTSAHYYRHVTDAFDYLDTPAMKKSRAALAAWSDASNAVIEKADKIEAALLDELIMSPDGAAALAYIAKAFA